MLAGLLAVLPAIGLPQAIGAERSFLGIQLQPLTEDLAKAFGVSPSTHGIVVSGVRDDSPAAKVGVKAGDVIVEYDGQAVARPRDLADRVAATPIGKTVTMKVLRGGQEMILSPTTAGVEVRERSEGGPAEGPKTGKFGLALEPLTPELAHRLQTVEKQGLVVRAVRRGSPAEQAGLRRGDVITEVNRQPLNNVEELRSALEQATPDKPTLLLVQRRGFALYVPVKG
jgi:serine protease Do